MPGHALLIDAMGTLVFLDDPVPRLVAGLRERCGLVVDPATASAALRAEVTWYRGHMMEGRSEPALAALHRDCAGVLRDALGVTAPLEAMVEVLLGALRFTAFPDAAPALTRARRAGARVVVVSNWDASLVPALRRAGLASLLDGVVCSAAVGVAKPDPEIFARGLELAGIAPEAAVHVGDSLRDDVAGARAAGIRAIWLRRDPDASGAPPAGVPVVAGLGELAGALASGP